MQTTRYSKQRERIYEALKSSREHPSAETLYRSLKPLYPSLSLGTVYRNLNFLVEEGRAIRIDSDISRYDAAMHEHAHFYCTHCGELYDLPLQLEESLGAAVAAIGHEVIRHKLIFEGQCAHCKQQDTQSVS